MDGSRSTTWTRSNGSPLEPSTTFSASATSASATTGARTSSPTSSGKSGEPHSSTTRPRYRRFAILACTVAKRRAIDWRDRHSGKLVEIDMNPELPPIDEGDLGRFYTFARGEEVSADHEAVLNAPGAFEPVED